MPQRDAIHEMVKQALLKEGWEITDDPYIISYGERFLFVDIGAIEADEGQIIGVQRENKRIAVEVKNFQSKSVIADLEQAIGQYILYQLLLNKVDPTREIYLAITDVVYDEIFSEPIGEVVINDLPLQLLIVESESAEVQQWIPSPPIVTS